MAAQLDACGLWTAVLCCVQDVAVQLSANGEPLPWQEAQEETEEGIGNSSMELFEGME